MITSFYNNTILYYYNKPLYIILIVINDIEVLNYLLTKGDRL